jgi:NAD(P)-dependent dehydrogenase (short-subunit alcohol dehydrogenase family)
LLHSAADLGTLQPLADINGNAWQTSLLVNLTAPFLLTKALLPLLNQAEHSSIVFTTDSSARGNKAYWGAYGLAKNAIENLAHIWAAELESVGKVRIHIFSPGPTRSAIRRRSHPGELLDNLPVPDILAERYVHLLHPEFDAPNGALVEYP